MRDSLRMKLSNLNIWGSLSASCCYRDVELIIPNIRSFINWYKEYILDENQEINTPDCCNTFIYNEMELRNRNAIIIHPLTLTLYVMFILVFSVGSLVAGYRWRAVQEENLLKAQQITSSHREFTAKNEKPNSSVNLVENNKE
jgi:hypothetical protein